MNKFYIAVFTLALAGALIVFQAASEPITQQAEHILQTSPTEQPTPFVPQTQTVSVFMPYWSLEGSVDIPNGILDQQEPNRLLYFGVSASTTGIDTTEQGYAALSTFTQRYSSHPDTHLTVRMLNESINDHHFENATDRETLINDTISIAQRNNFKGVVLDLEHSVLPTQRVRDNVTAFITEFGQKVSAENLEVGITIFGDTYYRNRPYELDILEQYVDDIYIMAYDFHKARGVPGPNFPFDSVNPDGKPVYPYSYKAMLDDFLADVPAEKIHILYGMFGYVWEVDDQERPNGPANSFTFNRAKQRYLTTCAFLQCEVTRDPASAEYTVSYLNNGQRTVAWFEHPESIAAKQDYADTKGIKNIGFWAHGYY